MRRGMDVFQYIKGFLKEKGHLRGLFAVRDHVRQGGIEQSSRHEQGHVALRDDMTALLLAARRNFKALIKVPKARFVVHNAGRGSRRELPNLGKVVGQNVVGAALDGQAKVQARLKGFQGGPKVTGRHLSNAAFVEINGKAKRIHSWWLLLVVVV